MALSPTEQRAWQRLEAQLRQELREEPADPRWRGQHVPRLRKHGRRVWLYSVGIVLALLANYALTWRLALSVPPRPVPASTSHSPTSARKEAPS